MDGAVHCAKEAEPAKRSCQHVELHISGRSVLFPEMMQVVWLYLGPVMTRKQENNQKTSVRLNTP